jgi:hypothetical protein
MGATAGVSSELEKQRSSSVYFSNDLFGKGQTMKRAHLFFFIPLLVAKIAAASSDPLEDCKTAAGGSPYVCFDHAQRAWIQPIGEISREGDPLKVVILHTDPNNIVVVTKQVVETPKTRLESELPQCKDKTKVDTIFPAGEGRYTLEIGFNEEACQGLEDVPATEFRVHVLGWEQSVAGGFIGSDHKDPQFSTYTRPVNNQTLTFVEQEPSDRGNEARLGLSSFIHLYHEGFERWTQNGIWAKNLLPTGFSFGLGIGEQNRTSYSVGPSWRFGDKGFLTVGYSWAPVDRLPAGVRTCPRSSESCEANLAITDPNRISSLSQRTKGAAFISLSYSFITLGSFFEDRFREAIKASGSPQTPTPPASRALTENDLSITCAPEESQAGDEVTVTVSVAGSTAQKPLRLEMGEQFEALTEAERGDWKPCSDADADNLASCYELASDKFDPGAPETIKFHLKSDVEPDTYQSQLQVGDESEPHKTCNVVVTEE